MHESHNDILTQFTTKNSDIIFAFLYWPKMTRYFDENENTLTMEYGMFLLYLCWFIIIRAVPNRVFWYSTETPNTND